MRLAAAAVTLCLLAGAGSARELFVLRWSQPSQLAALDTDRLVTRYIAPGIAVVEADSAALPHIAALGFDIAASGTAGAGEAWYLSDHLHYPLPPGQELLYLDRRGWALSKIGEADFGRVHDEQIFLYPLPDRFAVDGWVPAPRHKRTAPAAAAGVEEVIAEVDVERVREDIVRLSLIDPSRGSVEGNLHTRFARRPETFESTRYIREQLAAVLGDDAVRLQEFTISEGDSVMYNVIGELSGADPEAGVLHRLRPLRRHRHPFARLGLAHRSGSRGRRQRNRGRSRHRVGAGARRPAVSLVDPLHRLVRRGAGALGQPPLRRRGAGR